MSDGAASVVQVLNSIFENQARERREDRDVELDILRMKQQEKMFKQELALKEKAQNLALQEFNMKKREEFKKTINDVKAPIIAGRNASLDAAFNATIRQELDNYGIVKTDSGKVTGFDWKKFKKLYVDDYGFTEEQAERLYGLSTAYYQDDTNSELMVKWLEHWKDYTGQEAPKIFADADKMHQQVIALQKELSDIQLGDYEFDEYQQFLTGEEIKQLEAEAKRKEMELKGKGKTEDLEGELPVDFNLNSRLGMQYDESTMKWSLNTPNLIGYKAKDWAPIDRGASAAEKELRFENQIAQINNTIKANQMTIEEIQARQNNLRMDSNLDANYDYENSEEYKTIQKTLKALEDDIFYLEREKGKIEHQEAEFQIISRGESWEDFKESVKGSINYIRGTRYGDTDAQVIFDEEAGGFRTKDSLTPEGRRTLIGDIIYPVGKMQSVYQQWIDDLESYEETYKK